MQAQIISLTKDLYGISMPKQLGQEMGFMAGYKFTMEKGKDGNSLILRPVKNTTRARSKYGNTSKEFDRWFRKMTKEDAEIIEELGKR